jgi:hypothetical protein
MTTQQAPARHPQLAAELSGAHPLGEVLGTSGYRRWKSDLSASRRAWAVRPRRRRALARELRRTAALTEPPSRLDRVAIPVLLDRVATARAEMLDLAVALECSSDPDPDAIAIVRKLLRDGCSPIYNPNAPATQLTTALSAARTALASGSV